MPLVRTTQGNQRNVGDVERERKHLADTQVFYPKNMNNCLCLLSRPIVTPINYTSMPLGR